MQQPIEQQQIEQQQIEQQLRESIAESKVLLFMKGTPKLPMCGFSSRVCERLRQCGKSFDYVDVIANPSARALLPGISDWPTFPQLFVKGELIGGCDIVEEMASAGELCSLLSEAVGQAVGEGQSPPG